MPGYQVGLPARLLLLGVTAESFLGETAGQLELDALRAPRLELVERVDLDPADDPGDLALGRKIVCLWREGVLRAGRRDRRRCTTSYRSPTTRGKGDLSGEAALEGALSRRWARDLGSVAVPARPDGTSSPP